MDFLISIIFSFGILICGTTAVAQSSLEGFSTGRYEIHKSTKSRKLSSVDQEVPKPVVNVAEKVTAAPATDKGAAVIDKKIADDKASVDKKITEEKKESTSDSEANAEEPSISEQAESLFFNRAEKVYEYYRQEIHADDIRNNKIEVEFAPILGYNNSSSNYSFREYKSFFEALKLKANVWLTPLIGISGQILFSFGADIDDANRSKLSTKYEYLDLSLNFRKFFGVSRKANSLEFAVLYSDNAFNTSKDSTLHSRLKSNGFGVGLKARFPTSISYAWTVGGTFFPRLQHSESATAVDVSSGSADENARIGFDVGGEWKFSRHSQMIWNLGISSEKNLFTGKASLPDSSTGVTPSNVSVTNTMYLMNLGYRWGH